MPSRITLALVSIAAAWQVTAISARADSLPPDQTIYYLIRTEPTDPESAVVRTIVLELTAREVRRDYVGWHVQSMTVTKLNSAGQTVAVWAKALPDVPSLDGLWWVQHADTQQPELPEFAMPPTLKGTATSQTTGVDDLDYALSGVPYVPPPSGPPYDGRVAALDYQFIIVGEPEPDEGDDEPVELHGDGSMG